MSGRYRIYVSTSPGTMQPINSCLWAHAVEFMYQLGARGGRGGGRRSHSKALTTSISKGDAKEVGPIPEVGRTLQLEN